MYVITQIIGFVLTFYIYIIWRLHHKLDTSTDNIFVLATVVAMLSQIGDIMCQLVMSKTIPLSELAIHGVVDFYLISIPCYVLSIALYVNRIINDTKKYERIRLFFFIFLLISSIVTILLPLSYTYHPACSLPEGAATLYTYFISGFIAMFLLVLLFKNRKKITPWKYYATAIWIGIFLVGGFLQLVLINILYVPVISLVIAIGVLVLYLIIENPGNRFDYDQNCFHYDAFIEYINEVILNKELKCLLYLNFAFKNNDNFIYIKDIFNDLIKVHDKNSKIIIFKGKYDELIVASRDFAELQYFGTSIFNSINAVESKLESFQDYQASIALIPSVSNIKNFDSLRNIFDNYRIRNNIYNEPVKVFTVSEKMIDRFNNETSLVTQVDEAIKNNRVIVGYQTIHSNSNKDVVNAEANVSLQVEDGTILKPSDYIVVAEKYNKFLQIDEISLRNVCKTIYNIERKNNNLGVIFVRVSVQIIESDDFVKNFVSVLNRNSVSLSKICLEITNAKSITKKELFVNNLKTLQNHGIKIAIGGFGSGESNLNYFIDLPANFVKYDQSVLANALVDEKAAMIMKEITNLASNLGYSVISVGVEDESGKQFVSDCNIDLSMGNLVSTTYSENDFINYVTTGGNK